MDKKKIDRSKLAITSRTKGHNLERKVVNKLKEIGYAFAKTSRLASTLLDNCQVDIAFVPYLIQTKKGYPKGLNYTNILKEIKSLLKVNFPPDEKVHNYPCIIIHDKGRKSEEKLVIMEEKSFWEIVKKLKELEDLNNISDKV